MKAVRATDAGVAVVELGEAPGMGELLQIRAASICISDFAYMANGSRRVMGHELAGIREDGTPVVVESIYGCMDCAQCRVGRYNLCSQMSERALGWSIDGGMAEMFRAPAERLVPLPAGLDVRDGSLVEPGGVAWHAARLGGVGPNTRVAVVGVGALGLLAVAAARHMGAPEIAVEAWFPHQAGAAERLGARVGTDGLYDVVIEAGGTPESLARSIELVAPAGTVSALGVHFGKVEVDWMHLFHREARVIPSISFCAHDGVREMEEVAAMLAADPEIPNVLITHRFPIEDAVEAFRVANDKSTGSIRVVIEPAA
jgi:threonine dehydrogenase-like Zn-dependent dehydrogenase